jgi:hypothetical protein
MLQVKYNTMEETIIPIWCTCQCSRQKCTISACARDFIERNYTREQIYICSDSEAAFQALEATRITTTLV